MMVTEQSALWRTWLCGLAFIPDEARILFMDGQQIAALAVVATTLSVSLLVTWRRRSRGTASGCGGGCCPARRPTPLPRPVPRSSRQGQ
jgi:hypothetical protein